MSKYMVRKYTTKSGKISLPHAKVPQSNHHQLSLVPTKGIHTSLQTKILSGRKIETINSGPEALGHHSHLSGRCS